MRSATAKTQATRFSTFSNVALTKTPGITRVRQNWIRFRGRDSFSETPKSSLTFNEIYGLGPDQKKCVLVFLIAS